MAITRAKFDGAQSASTVVVIDSTATLVTYPPQHLRGDIAGVTVRVGTPSTAMPAKGAGDAATLSSLNTTVATSALRGAKSITLTDATGAVTGRRILVGAQLEVEAKSISGNVLTLQRPLVEDVDAGVAVKGLDITHELTAGETSTLGHGTAIWHVTATEDNWTQPLLIAPRSTVYNLNMATLRAKHPIVDRLAIEHDRDFHDVMQTAWDDEVARFLLRQGLDPAYIVDWLVLDAWHATAVVYRLFLELPSVDDADVKRWAALVRTQRDSALEDRRFWYSDTEEVEVQGGPIPGTSRRSFRR